MDLHDTVPACPDTHQQPMLPSSSFGNCTVLRGTFQCFCVQRRYLWFGLPLTSLAWWGAVSYTVGVGLYIGAAVSTIINDCPNTLLEPYIYVRFPPLSHTAASCIIIKECIVTCLSLRVMFEASMISRASRRIPRPA